MIKFILGCMLITLCAPLEAMHLSYPKKIKPNLIPIHTFYCPWCAEVYERNSAHDNEPEKHFKDAHNMVIDKYSELLFDGTIIEYNEPASHTNPAHRTNDDTNNNDDNDSTHAFSDDNNTDSSDNSSSDFSNDDGREYKD